MRQELQKFVDDKKIQAGFVATCVGGLQKAILRMADATPDHQDVREFNETYEIVALVGTLSSRGSHLHIALSDKDGKVMGGHLKEGSFVAYTAEVVIGEIEHQAFKRLPDEETGFDELVVESTS